MRGGPSLKGKGGLVGFRRSLKVQGMTGGFSNIKEVQVVFRRFKKLLLFFRMSTKYF